MNQLKVGVRVFSNAGSDGKAHPTHYLLEQQGTVDKITKTSCQWGSMMVFPGASEKQFLIPTSDGFSYFIAELPEMDKYKDGNLYKVPTKILKEHMKSYKSPWEV